MWRLQINAATTQPLIPVVVDNTALATAKDLSTASSTINLAEKVTIVEPRQALQVADNIVCLVRGRDSDGDAAGVIALMQSLGKS